MADRAAAPARCGTHPRSASRSSRARRKQRRSPRGVRQEIPPPFARRLPRYRYVPLPQSCANGGGIRSEEHTSELQSHLNLVCRLLLEKKKKKIILIHMNI